MLKHLQNGHKVDLECYKATLKEMGEDNKRQMSKKREYDVPSSITEFLKLFDFVSENKCTKIEVLGGVCFVSCKGLCGTHNCGEQLIFEIFKWREIYYGSQRLLSFS